MVTLVLIAALFTGFLLGILGGGGSIITVPTFVYLLGFSPKISLCMSLGIVSLTSLYGSLRHGRKKNIDYPTFFFFALFSIPGVYFGSSLANEISGKLQMVLFGFVMIVSAYFMFRNGSIQQSTKPPIRPLDKNMALLLGVQGTFLGFLTGLIGIGGGFIIVPFLVLMKGIPIHRAIATSIPIITTTTFNGFIGYVLHDTPINWEIFIIFLLASLIGMHLGIQILSVLSQHVIKKAFSILLFIIGIFMCIDNGYKLFAAKTHITFDQKPRTKP